MKIKASVKNVTLDITNDAGESVLTYSVKDLAYEGDVTGLAEAIAANADKLKAAGNTIVLAFVKPEGQSH